MDDAQLSDLYQRYGYLVLRRCRAILQRDEDAEDALQETFLRIRRLDATPDDGGSTLAWLYTVARRVCFDLLEKRRRHPLADDDGLDALERHGHGDAADADRRALVGAALRGLDGKTRAIGVLHYLDGYTQEEVAARTGFSRRTVGKKLAAFEERVRVLWRGGKD